MFVNIYKKKCQELRIVINIYIIINHYLGLHDPHPSRVSSGSVPSSLVGNCKKTLHVKCLEILDLTTETS